MASEPRISSEGEPRVSEEPSTRFSPQNHHASESTSTLELDTAVYPTGAEEIRHEMRIEPRIQDQERPNIALGSPYEPSLLNTLVSAGLLFTVIMGSAWGFGKSSDGAGLVYCFLFGEGGAHLMSQSCTIALFCWGLCATMSSLLRLESERREIHTLKQEKLRVPQTPLGLRFYHETVSGLARVRSYLECRAVIEESRERLIERLESESRGSAAAMWLIPLSGFLGTVIGMSLTIGRFDELFASASGEAVKLIGLSDLAPAIQGLSTAFDTTLLALALVIPLKLTMVAQERRGGRLVNELESSLGEPLLIARLSQADHLEDDSSELALQKKLATLTEQSAAINRSLLETSQYLAELRAELTAHPALKLDRPDASSQKVQEESLALLRDLALHQAKLGEQVIALKESAEAPLVIQRAPLSSRES